MFDVFKLLQALEGAEKNRGSYDERKVARFEDDCIIISTALCYDAEVKPYETAVSWDDDTFVVVDVYDTKEDAEKGHEMWIGKYKRGEIPRNISLNDDVRMRGW